jgi:AraC-like DNA-binding protein
MDPLSDVLRAVRLNGAFFYFVEARAPWSVAALPARDLAPRIMPEAEHLISYHIVTSGTCWGGVVGDSQVQLQPGDVLVFPHGDAHLMASEPGHRVVPQVAGESPERYPGTVHVGSGETCSTTFVCGFLGCDARPFNPLLASLPRRLHIPRVTGGWLSEFPRQVVAESQLGRAGADTMLTRMAELMFIEVVRRHVETLEPEQTGWLAGLRDPVVGPALACLHERPAHAWTLAELAQEVASSRTVLAERFTEVLGIPPMQYLTQWRLQLAAAQLLRGQAKVSAVGVQVGYESEAAFSRAFKRATGLSPAAWRAKRISA